MSTISIRSAVPGDGPRILEFIRSLARYESLDHEVVADAAQIEDTLFGDKPNAEVVFASVNGECAGFALFFFNYSTFLGKPGLYLEDLFVEPEHRGSGVGQALLGHLASVAVERNCGRMEWSVLDWNQPAIEFYQRIGARPMKGWNLYRITGKALTDLATQCAKS